LKQNVFPELLQDKNEVYKLTERNKHLLALEKEDIKKQKIVKKMQKYKIFE